MLEDADKVLLPLGLKLVNAVAAAFAAFAALRFFNGLTVAEKWTTFFGGWGLAAWGAAPLNAYLELKPAVEVGIVLLIGLFGIAVSAELMKVVKTIDWKDLLDTILRRKTGG
jgi:hypothetical protein